MDKKGFIVSFGDSNKFFAPFEGTINEFKKSAEFNSIKEAIYSFIKSKFPAANIPAFLQPEVHQADGKDAGFPLLDKTALEDLKNKALREIEVGLADKRLNLNAPEAKIN